MRGHNERSFRLDELAAEARNGLEAVEKGEEFTIGGWLAYGHALNEGRALFPSDEQFGQWIDENGLRQLVGHEGAPRDVNEHERAAAMWAATNADQFEEARQRGNPRTIRGIHAKWKEIEAERAEEERRKRAEERAAEETRSVEDDGPKDDTAQSEQETPPTNADPATGEAFANGASGGGDRPPAPAPDPYGYADLTEEALLDLANGLRADLEDAKAEITALKSERDDLKARIRDLSEGNQGRVISRLHTQIVALKGARDDALEKAAKETRRANAMERQRNEARKSLERKEINL